MSILPVRKMMPVNSMKPEFKHGGSSIAWNDFRQMVDPLDPDMNLEGRTTWRSTLYQVIRSELDDGSVWLSIKRNDKKEIRDWRHFQEIKNQLVGKEREAVEIFPAESRLVDTSNQFHLFVLPEGKMVPYGYLDREVGGQEMADLYGARQREWEPEIEPTDLASDLSTKVRMIGPKPFYHKNANE